jgi:hypothetical protein
MRENRPSGSEGGGANPIVSPYPYLERVMELWLGQNGDSTLLKQVVSFDWGNNFWLG